MSSVCDPRELLETNNLLLNTSGALGVDVALILSVAMLLKARKEEARYRHIDEKNGAGGF